MNITRALTCWTSLCLGLSISLSANADLFWCETEEGRSSLVEVKPDGAVCRLISKDKPRQNERTNSSSSRSIAPEPSAADKPDEPDFSNEEFPLIGIKEQATRDQVRGQILTQELQREKATFDFLRSRLNGPRGARMGLEEKQYFQRRMHNSAQNIKALQQELARLR